LVVVAAPEAGISARPGDLAATAVDVGPLNRAMGKGQMTPLFGVSEERLRHETTRHAAETGAIGPDLSVYYRVEAVEEGRMEEVAEALMATEGIVGAYVKPPVEPAVEDINTMTPSEELAPPITPDFNARQLYLDPAPGGIDARFAWTKPGGRGAGVRIIDIEGAWRFDQEDLITNQGGVVGTQSTALNWRNHGTAVCGEFGGDDNGIGVIGICSDAMVRGFSVFNGTGTAAPIRAAADALGAGDIILIELHRAGPGASGAGQDGFIAMEWWPDDFDAIRYAFTRGVIVVEAAGNGARNLDDPIYNTPQAGFPPGWTNPFNRSNRDSGAIVVGAGAPPPGTHGADHGPDRSRLDFSNYGALVDAQGWGREVTTTGYGDLQGGTNETIWYTDRFSGTSSASPIVVGALGCVQGIRRARGQAPLTPTQARAALRSSGSPQQDAPGRPVAQRIGNRPNLRQLIGVVKPIIKEAVKEKFEKIENKEFKREKAEIKELKQEKLEAKELKREKIEIKEVQEKIPEKIPDKIRDKFEEKIQEKIQEKVQEKLLETKRKEIVEGFQGQLELERPTDVGGVEARLGALEASMEQLRHFIGGELRPDLGGGALIDEPKSYEEGMQKLSEG
jgi:hypothetical protein